MSIDRVSFWAKNQIVYATPTSPPHQLNSIAKMIRRDLKHFHQQRRNFVPHVTLARKTRRRIQTDIAPIEWQVRGLYLIRSTLTDQGAVYETLVRSNQSA